MGYYIDLSSISIDFYKEKLKSSFLVPSRMILKERLDERFDLFRKLKIVTIKELQQFLKKKGVREELSKIECFSGDYLVILLREINSIQPKPNKIKEFDNISPQTIVQLEKIGIKDTVDLFEKIKTKKARVDLSQQTGIDENEVLSLAKLTDLSRIKWVGTTFAQVLLKSGYDTVEKVANANYEELYSKITQMNKEQNIYKGQIGLNDMNRLVEAAKEVSLEIGFG